MPWWTFFLLETYLLDSCHMPATLLWVETYRHHRKNNTLHQRLNCKTQRGRKNTTQTKWFRLCKSLVDNSNKRFLPRFRHTCPTHNRHTKRCCGGTIGHVHNWCTKTHRSELHPCIFQLHSLRNYRFRLFV